MIRIYTFSNNMPVKMHSRIKKISYCTWKCIMLYIVVLNKNCAPKYQPYKKLLIIFFF